MLCMTTFILGVQLGCIVWVVTTSRDRSRKPRNPSDDLDDLFEELATLEREAAEAAVEPVALTGPMFDIDGSDEELLFMSEEEAEALALRELGDRPSRETQAKVSALVTGLTRIERLLREIDSEYDVRDPRAAEAMRLSKAAMPLVALRDVFELAVLAYRGGARHAGSLLAARLESCLKVTRAHVARSGDRDLVVLLGVDVERPADLSDVEVCFEWCAEQASRLEARLKRAVDELPDGEWLVPHASAATSRTRVRNELTWARTLVTALSGVRDTAAGGPEDLESMVQTLIEVGSVPSQDPEAAGPSRRIVVSRSKRVLN